MTRNKAINWCEESLPQWPTGAMALDVLARPLGWEWKQSLALDFIPFVFLCNGIDMETIIKADIPKFQEPKPMSHLVSYFLKIIANEKKRPLETQLVSVDQEGFNELYESLPEFKNHANIIMTESVYDNVKVIVLNKDINIINGFITNNLEAFKVFLNTYNRLNDCDKIRRTLIGSKLS